MAAITLKSLSTTLHRALKARATRHKRSLNQEVIAVLEEAVAPSRRVDVEATRIDKHRRLSRSEVMSNMKLTPKASPHLLLRNPILGWCSPRDA